MQWAIGPVPSRRCVTSGSRPRHRNMRLLARPAHEGFSLTAAIRSSIAATFGKISVGVVSSVSMFRQNMCDGSSKR